MPEIVADRFVALGPSWIDLATGAPVRIRVTTPASRGEQIDWAGQCARLANMRHPLLHALVDYGALDRTRTFEAYECGGPISASGAAAERLLDHAVRFLEANAIALPPGQATYALRQVVAGTSPRARPVGLILQPRRALRSVAEALDAAGPPGPCRVVVTGAHGSGLRTLALAVARTARLAGYVPVAAWLPRVHPWLVSALDDRHVCVLEAEGHAGAPAAGFLATLACRSARRHAVVALARGEPRGARSLPLDPLGVTAMTHMVFVDGTHGPDPVELLAAVRRAGGYPGALVAELGGESIPAPHLFRVRETAPAYVAVASAPPADRARGRTHGAVYRAATRAGVLAAHGRHAAAARLLTRAVHVLDRRGEPAEAARCAVRLGELLLSRGRPAAAFSWFERALGTAGGESARGDAAIGAGLARMAEGRFEEAEAALRGAIVAGAPPGGRATAALVRVLILERRLEDATAVVQSMDPGHAPCRELQTAIAELHLAAGDVPAAVRSALAAIDPAGDEFNPAGGAAAERICAEALDAVGDRAGALQHARRGLELARAAHAPLVARQIRTTLERLRSAPEREPPIRPHAPAEIEHLLALAHAAVDESDAVGRVCEEVRERLHASSVLVLSTGPNWRVVASAGRPWIGEPAVAHRAIAAGAAVAPESHGPAEGAGPIALGGATIAALAARWAPGSTIAPARASAWLHAAAIAMAPFVGVLVEEPAPLATRDACDLLGDSPPADALRRAIERAARAPFPVLVEGESGSGKELVARRLHARGPRRDRRFCTLNCAALTDELLEAELFGHARGAFTGAVGERAGLFEEADGGTLFLDEIAELSARAQAKLLRVLQDGEVRRVGENVARHVDVRVIAATNRSLEREVAAGRFRADLRFRLDVVRIVVPPLRERAADVPLLAAHFWAGASARVDSRAVLTGDALAALARYDWPGNVRELQNVIAWIAVHSPRRGRIGPAGLPAHIAGAAPAAASFQAAREAFERRYINAALAGANGQRARAAESLGLTRQGLAKMMKRLGIQG